MFKLFNQILHEVLSEYSDYIELPAPFLKGTSLVFYGPTLTL